MYFAAFDGKRPAVLVTPACDLEHEKVSLWTFVALFPDVEVARQFTGKEIAGWGLKPEPDGCLPVSKNQREALEERVAALISQKYGRYHWLPVVIGGSPAQVADFTCVTSLPVDEVRGKAVRIASLRSSWREQVPARYAAYMGRVGTEDFARDELRAHIGRLVDSLIKP